MSSRSRRNMSVWSSLVLSWCSLHALVEAFSPAIVVSLGTSKRESLLPPCQSCRNKLDKISLRASDDGWKGEVVSNSADGSIRGCTITAVEGSLTEWTLTIDGIEADLGRFSEAIYKKIILDAKQQRFQGFRPGTIPPHLQPTYRAFAMDECAREAVLEALQQNNIRPFESTRSGMKLVDFKIPPVKKKKGGSKKKTKQSAKEATSGSEEVPQWSSFETMKEAIDAGWSPGQSFSFVAKEVKGQKVKDDSEVSGSQPLGVNY